MDELHKSHSEALKKWKNESKNKDKEMRKYVEELEEQISNLQSLLADNQTQHANEERIKHLWLANEEIAKQLLRANKEKAARQCGCENVKMLHVKMMEESSRKDRHIILLEEKIASLEERQQTSNGTQPIRTSLAQQTGIDDKNSVPVYIQDASMSDARHQTPDNGNHGSHACTRETNDMHTMKDTPKVSRPGVYTIDATEGFWRVPSHLQDDGPEEILRAGLTICVHSKKNICANDLAPCGAYVCDKCGHKNMLCKCVPNTFKGPLTKHETVETQDNRSTDNDSEEKFDSQRTEGEIPRVTLMSHTSTTATGSNRGNFRINHVLQGPPITNSEIRRCGCGLPLIQWDKGLSSECLDCGHNTIPFQEM